jgi:hypothetical protein
MKTLEPRVKVPLGSPNGYVLFNYWVKLEDQELDNIRQAFAIFDKTPERVFDARQHILQGLGSALIVTSPLREYPFHVFRSREVYFDFFYAVSDKGVEKDASWKYNRAIFVKDKSIAKVMSDFEAEKYARRISRKR